MSTFIRDSLESDVQSMIFDRARFQLLRPSTFTRILDTQIDAQYDRNSIKYEQSSASRRNAATFNASRRRHTVQRLL